MTITRTRSSSVRSGLLATSSVTSKIEGLLLGVVTASLASWLIERVSEEQEAAAATCADVAALTHEVQQLRADFALPLPRVLSSPARRRSRHRHELGPHGHPATLDLDTPPVVVVVEDAGTLRPTSPVQVHHHPSHRPSVRSWSRSRHT